MPSGVTLITNSSDQTTSRPVVTVGTSQPAQPSTLSSSLTGSASVPVFGTDPTQATTAGNNNMPSIGMSAYNNIYTGVPKYPLAPGDNVPFINYLQQVAGLVPFYLCCNKTDSYATLLFHATATTKACNSNSDTYSIIVNIGGHTYGPVTFINGTTTASALQSAVNSALVTSAGFTAANFQLNSDGSISGQINSPTGTGSAFNSETFSFDTSGMCLGTITQPFNYGTNCDGCTPSNDSRYGLHTNDYVPDDRNFVMPAFADLTCALDYNNDKSTFLTNLPLSSTFNQLKLQHLVGSTWTDVYTLNDNTMGTFITTGGGCTNINYMGYELSWNSVLSSFGEGYFRISAFSTLEGFCGTSPVYCLKQFSPIAADRTVRFDFSYTGGNIGSVTQQGQYWDMNCRTNQGATPLSYVDHVRFEGQFGYESEKQETTEIKYYTGYRKQVRNETIKSFLLKTDILPFDLLQRFLSYGMMADEIRVSDYNIANPNYNIKGMLVRPEGTVSPKYNEYSRYQRLDGMQFTDGQPFVFRDIAN